MLRKIYQVYYEFYDPALRFFVFYQLLWNTLLPTTGHFPLVGDC